MNNLIQKLAEQAEEYAAKNSTGDWEVGPAYQDLYNKKFAELLEAATRADESEACCVIVYGLCESDNVAQRTVDAIRARGTK